MSTIYLAERTGNGFRKPVAIRVMKLDIDTIEVLNRFRRSEDPHQPGKHLNIATILDGGATSDGRLFLVMEYVEGLPVDVFCRERHLGLEARLRLFLLVCEAVAYVHGKLIVYRDLKPDNILVTEAGIPRLSCCCGSPLSAVLRHWSQYIASKRWFARCAFCALERAAGLAATRTGMLGSPRRDL